MRLIFLSFLLILCLRGEITAQMLSDGNTAMITAVPFLNICPDSRLSAMGMAGAGSTPDINSQFINSAKYPFLTPNKGISVSYIPQAGTVSKDTYLGYLSAYLKTDNIQAFSASFRYYHLGNVKLTDMEGVSQGSITPNEFAVDVGYSRKLTSDISAGIVLRYIRSDIMSGLTIDDRVSDAANGIAADISLYYRKILRNDEQFALGLNISNLGSKLSYFKGGDKFYLPAIMRVGASYTRSLGDNSNIAFATDINKLLVPLTLQDTEVYGNTVVVGGKSADKSVIEGIFSSFNDSPSGFSGELEEVKIASGVEFKYQDRFSLRTGYFYENKDIGNGSYFSAGAGLSYDIFTFDFSYLAYQSDIVLTKDVFRFTISMDLSKMKALSVF